MNLILLEGMPGAGKSTVLKAISRKQTSFTLMHEFQFKREIITKDYGICQNGSLIECTNLKLKELEDKLENFILKSRFQDNSEEFDNIKIELAKERIKEMEKYNGIVIRESFFGGLIDKCSENVLKELSKLLTHVNTIFFLILDANALEERQRKRLEGRDGKFNDKTNKERNKLFLLQFYHVTERRVKTVYLDAEKLSDEIADEVIKSLG